MSLHKIMSGYNSINKLVLRPTIFSFMNIDELNKLYKAGRDRHVFNEMMKRIYKDEGAEYRCVVIPDNTWVHSRLEDMEFEHANVRLPKILEDFLALMKISLKRYTRYRREIIAMMDKDSKRMSGMMFIDSSDPYEGSTVTIEPRWLNGWMNEVTIQVMFDGVRKIVHASCIEMYKMIMDKQTPSGPMIRLNLTFEFNHDAMSVFAHRVHGGDISKTYPISKEIFFKGVGLDALDSLNKRVEKMIENRDDTDEFDREFHNLSHTHFFQARHAHMYSMDEGHEDKENPFEMMTYSFDNL